MDVILNMAHSRVNLQVAPSTTITRNEIYQQAGFTAKDNSGNSLMSHLHLGENGEYDNGLTVQDDVTLTLPSFYEAGGTFYPIGEAYDIHVKVIVLKPEPIIKTTPTIEPISLESEIPTVNFDMESPVPVSNEERKEPAPELNKADVEPVKPEFVETDIDPDNPNIHYFELEYKFGDKPGFYKIPAFDEKIPIPEGKELESAQLVIYPTFTDGTILQDIELADQAEFTSPHIVWTPGDDLSEPMPFGTDETPKIYGLWYGVIATYKDKPKPPTAWNRFRKQSPDSTLNTASPLPSLDKVEDTSSPLTNEVGEQSASELNTGEVESSTVPSDDGLSSIWEDSEPTVPNLDDGITDETEIPDLLNDDVKTPQPSLNVEDEISTPELNKDVADEEQADVVTQDEPTMLGAEDVNLDLELGQEPPKKKLFQRSKVKSPNTVSNKAPKDKKKSSKGMIALAVVIGMITLGAGTGGYMYYQTGIKSTKPLKTEIVKNNRAIAKYLDKSDISTEETSDLAALVQKNDDAFTKFKTSNVFAQMEENRLIKQTQSLIDQVYKKLNKSKTN